MAELSEEKTGVRLGILAGVIAVILAATLSAGWLSGMDLASTFLGTGPAHEYSRGMMIVKGVVITITIFGGGLFLATLMALVTKERGKLAK